jgi:predicted CXXCH cytochrome family protein
VRSIVCVVAVCAGVCVPTALAADKCLVCHAAVADTPSSLFARDIHHLKGISCAECHGGDASTDDMEKAMDRGAGFIGVPKGDSVSAVCARCHSDATTMAGYQSTLPTNQYVLLQSSVHGKLSISGKERIVQCTTCHNAHGITKVTDPASPVYPVNAVATCARCHGDAKFMRLYNPSLPVDQLEKYRTSVHGAKNAAGDTKTAQCASCHGSHDILSAKDVKSKVYPTNIPTTCASCHSNAAYMASYAIPTDQFEKYAKGVHGVALLEKHDLGAPACNNCHGNHGATPPGVESISKVCGICHALNADLFSSSPHKKGFDEMKKPECETCHGNHGIVAASNVLIGNSSGSVCSRCHSEKEREKGFVAAGVMRMLIDSLQRADDRARTLVDEAEQKGMEISEAKYKLRDVRQAQLETRTIVHAFSSEKLRETTGKGFAAAAVITVEANSAIDEYFFRRIGLGAATFSITVLAVSLYLYIRRIERKQRQAEASH